jgi:prepilin-type N-terminal cleavage/methylation domain-containing protein
MRKAFTLIELVVALGILAVVLAFAGAIFRVSVGAQRLAMANGEVMQKLRIITEQLDADFRGMLPTYGGELSVHSDKYSGAETHSDSVAFFANGDFQSTRQYNGRTIVGNVASILYGPPDPNSYATVPAPQNRLLLRRQTILYPLDPSDPLQIYSDWRGEYYCASLEQWRLAPPYTHAGDWAERPVIDPNDVQKYVPLYLARGVDNFTIFYFPGDAQWQTGPIPWSRLTSNGGNNIPMPRALKFEFTLYDSKGMIKSGRTFSHIVLLDR